MSSGQIINDHKIKALKGLLAHQDNMEEVRDVNFNKEVQVKNEINELKAKKDEEFEYIILRNRYFGGLDRDEEEKIIDKIEKSIREKENELKNWFAEDNRLIDLLLELDEVIKD